MSSTRQIVPEDYWFDDVTASKIGQYTTKTTQKFIDLALKSNSHLKSCLDVGAGSGRYFFVSLSMKRDSYTKIKCKK